jgi:MoxR-like ATPase
MSISKTTHEGVVKLLEQSSEILSGKKEVVELALTCILAKGHALIEDAPGVGKTTLVKYLAKSFGIKLNRIQFTNDLLPADIIGSPVYNKHTGEFHFHPGPIFGEIVLADELNRAPSKTQSALLQAMEEKKVTVENETYSLPKYFMVFATQNPKGQVGTYELPESQLDRFTCKFHIGHPDKESTIKLLSNHDLEEKLSQISAPITIEQLILLQQEVNAIHIEESLLEYIYLLLNTSRQGPHLPLSNRCGIDVVKMSKARAFLHHRDYVLPDDIQSIFPYVAGHRLVSPYQSSIELEQQLAHEILAQVPIRK